MATMTAALRRLRRLEFNPVLVKELRSRFRGARAFWTLSAFVTALTVIVWWSYRRLGGSPSYGPYGPQAADPAVLGRVLYQTISWLEMIGILLIAPALTFSAISGERERQTLDLLLATPLSAWAIVRGKLGAAMAYVLLLVFSALPVLSLVFYFGGVSWQDVLRSQLAVVMAGLTLAALGLLVSVVARHTVRAAVLAYVGTGLLVLMPWILIGFLRIGSGRPLLSSVFVAMSPLTMLVGPDRGFFWSILLAQVWLASTFLVLAGWRLTGTLQVPRRWRRMRLLLLLLIWLGLAVIWVVWIAITHPDGFL